MKTKTSLWLSICTIALCLGVMMYGVYSALSANLNISGSLGFNMHNPMITITTKIQNYSEKPMDDIYSAKTEKNLVRTYMSEDDKLTITLKYENLYFFQNQNLSVDDIIFEITFTNICGSTLQALLVQPTLCNEVSLNTDEATGYTQIPSDGFIIQNKESYSLKFALKLNNVSDLLKNISISFIDISFTKIDIPESFRDEQGLIYTFHPTTLSWSVKGDWYLNGTSFVNNMNKSITDVKIADYPHGYPVTHVEDKAFSNGTSSQVCSHIKKISFPNTLKIIGVKAFKYCRYLTSTLTIPDSVETIGDDAFHNCTGLTGVTIGNSVKTIGESAFYYCTGLKGMLTIPNSVQTIGSWAFHDCSGLTNTLTISNTVISIGSYAFGGCSGLEGILVADGNTKYDSRNNCNALIETTTNKLMSGCKNSFIPNSIKTIDSYAFSGCKGLTGMLTIPNSVETIGDRAFYACTGLTGVTIGNSVKTIKDEAFYICRGLTGTLTIPDSVTNIGEKAFGTCENLTNAIIGNSVEKIPEHMFSYCDRLIWVTIGNKVKTIGDSAFYSCDHLTSVAIGSSVATISEKAFSNCNKLVSVTNKSQLSLEIGKPDYGYVAYYAKEVVDDENKSKLKTNTDGYIIYDENILIGYAGAETDLTIPSGIIEIYSRAFYHLDNLLSISIPNSVKTIDIYAFCGCEGLTSITIPNSIETIDNYAFSTCESLTAVTFEGTTPPTFGTKVYVNCNNLKNIYVPVESLQLYKANEYLKTLTNITFSAI